MEAQVIDERMCWEELGRQRHYQVRRAARKLFGLRCEVGVVEGCREGNNIGAPTWGLVRTRAL